jgi:trehalose 6-phosphate phosphatase
MQRILSPDNVEVLAQFAWSNALVAFDFDGTLAPIVADRDRASMRPRTRDLFDQVCRLYPCAVISGRGRADVARRLTGSHVRYIVGNHGVEPGKHMATFERQIADALLQLQAALPLNLGIDIEDKRFSLAIHYRRSRRKRDARRVVYEALAELALPLRATAGKLVVNVVSARAPHKGDALLQLRAKARADTAIYVGDDVTDEDVFQLDQPGRLLSIRVGRARASAAPYYLRSQAEIDTLLSRLIRLRKEEPEP